MKTKAAPPISLIQGRKTLPLIETYFELNHLKQLFRQGWLRVGIPSERCESVAEHSLFVALLGLFIAEGYFPQADASKVVRIALLHDLGEAYAGDITPHDGVDREAKHALERRAVETILGKLPRGADYLALWDEYEHGTSFEARLVRQLDRLEMGLQACVYEHQGAGDLSQFFVSVEKALESPELRAVLAEIEALRPE
ncbi:HD domain-containing protein [Pyxidicoccus fallax]|uniref:5'-deoxynucleotidase n=1 Tax=Pyxidicoccus fallax TaxID=394095 RepID=A0A848LRY0_9BACT|nr:HD domain-containing protein [Pyxidicoccus fallax]NMO20698.1 HD domain-containing protein [Pyxidicoccus fallax]NPC82532.1 HD domain-containing protein [Pyxidicoccus fallax]